MMQYFFASHTDQSVFFVFILFQCSLKSAVKLSWAVKMCFILIKLDLDSMVFYSVGSKLKKNTQIQQTGGVPDVTTKCKGKCH